MYVMGSLRGAQPLFLYFPLSFILPRKERGIKGVRLKIIPHWDRFTIKTGGEVDKIS